MSFTVRIYYIGKNGSAKGGHLRVEMTAERACE